MMKDFPKGHFEAVAEELFVFCRYVGPPSAEPVAAEADADDQSTVVDAAVVRAWGASNGFEIKERGRLSPEVIAAYNAAQETADA